VVVLSSLKLDLRLVIEVAISSLLAKDARASAGNEGVLLFGKVEIEFDE